MKKKELKNKIIFLEKELEIQKRIGAKDHDLYLNGKEFQTYQGKQIESCFKTIDEYENKATRILNDFSDVLYDISSRMNVFLEVQNVCIKSMGADLEDNNRPEHYAWFFSYVHDLLKREAKREFEELQNEFKKGFQQ